MPLPMQTQQQRPRLPTPSVPYATGTGQSAAAVPHAPLNLPGSNLPGLVQPGTQGYVGAQMGRPSLPGVYGGPSMQTQQQGNNFNWIADYLNNIGGAMPIGGTAQYPSWLQQYLNTIGVNIPGIQSMPSPVTNGGGRFGQIR